MAEDRAVQPIGRRMERLGQYFEVNNLLRDGNRAKRRATFIALMGL